MPTYRVQTSLQDVSGLPRDRYVNSWYFATTEVPILASTLDTLVDGQVSFYSGLAPLLSSGISTNLNTTKIYLIGAPKETPPVRDATWTFGTAPGSAAFTNLPTEVACCATFHADPQPGVMRQSWRGRCYIGPFNAGVLAGTGSGGGSGRPNAGIVNAILSGCGDWDAACNAAGGRWVIYSRKLARVFPVAVASVDDAFDTQRRRGIRPTLVTKGAALHGAGVPPGPA